MGRGRTFFGILISAIYLIWIAVLILPKLSTIPELALNEIGDFFAGVFGPLAFLWLVLGYFQQGAELRLQAAELKNSVEQQKIMAEATRQQVANQSKELEQTRARENEGYKANFAISARHKMTTSEGVRSELKITNVGGDAMHVLIFSPSLVEMRSGPDFGLIKRNEVLEFPVVLPAKHGKADHQLIILYEDTRHLRYQVIYCFHVEDGRFSKFQEVAHTNGSPV